MIRRSAEAAILGMVGAGAVGWSMLYFFFQAEDGIRAGHVTGVQTCALPISGGGVGYGSKSENVNFQVNVYYRLPTLPLRIGGDVGFSKPETDLTEIESNLNVHFMVVDSDLLSL